MAKKNNTAIIILVVGVILFLLFNNGTFDFLGASVSQGGTSSISRSFSTLSPSMGSVLTVNLDVDVGSTTDCIPSEANLCNDYYVIEEIVPLDVSVISLSNNVDCEVISTVPEKIVCVDLQDAIDNTVSYSVQLPDVPTQLAFSGSYMFQGDSAINTIGGDNVVSIQGTPQPTSCTSNWVCTEWSEWSDSERVCGGRTRTCTDSNLCNDLSTKPKESETKICPQVGGNIIILIVLMLLMYLLTSKRKKKRRRKR